METPDVLLCSTLHDPKGVFLNRIADATSEVLKNYKGWVVNVTNTTDEGVKNALRDLSNRGIYMTETDSEHTIVPDKIENDHLYLLTKAYDISEKLGVEKIQYTDGDRIITAATHFPDGLQNMAEVASEQTGTELSYINFRRSLTDTLTHHGPLVFTEAVFNGIYSKAFGIPIDIGSTAHSMSKDVLEGIIRKSPSMESVSFPHPKWLLIAKEMGAHIQSVETKNVLSFETPDQNVHEVESRTGDTYPDKNKYNELQTAYLHTLGQDSYHSIKEWELRFNTSRQYLSVLKNNLGILRLSEDKEVEIGREIDRKLGSMEVERQETIRNISGMDSEKK